MTSIETIKGTDAWVEKISNEELPSLCTTVKMLQNIPDDENLSLAQLGQTILQDNGLTSRILRISNSVAYNRSNTQITTISKAVILLGFNAIKQISITTKLVDSLLQNNNISESVYQRLLKLLAQSLQAALLAKNLQSAEPEEKQEAAYIASLLYNIGECAFWSIGGSVTTELDQALKASPDNPEAEIRRVLGTTFKRISTALAESWNMGPLLNMALKDSRNKPAQIQIITEANELSQLLFTEKLEPEILEQKITRVAKILEIEAEDVQSIMKKSAEETLQLTVEYGALTLAPFLEESLHSLLEKPVEYPCFEADEIAQLKIMRDLTKLGHTKSDINMVIQTALRGLTQAVGLDRVVMMMINRERTLLSGRFEQSIADMPLKELFVLNANAKTEHVFDQCLLGSETIWVKSHTNPHWKALLPVEVKNITAAKGFFIAPVSIDKQKIGVIYADRVVSGRPLTPELFDDFTHLTQHLCLCLSAVVRS